MIEGRVWEDIRGPRSALATIFPWALLALLLPSIAGGVVIHQIFYFAMVADIVWLCVRAARMYPDGRVVIAVMFVVMAGLQSLTAIYEFKTGHFLNLYGSAGNNTYATSKYFFVFKNSVRTTGTFFDPISLGNVLALALPLAMVIAISSQVKASWRALCVISIVAIMPALVISLSRASWIGAMVGLVAACVFARHGERERAFMASIALVVVTVIAALSYFGLTLIARFQTLLHPTSLSASTRNGDLARQAGWSASLHTFYQHPFAGVGFGRLLSTLENLPGANANAHASSVYLQYLAEGGLLGGLALLLFAVAIVVDLRRAGRNDVLFPALVGCSAVLAATWYTDFTVRYNAVAGCVAVIIGLIASGSQRVVRSSDHVVQPQLVVLDA